MTSPSQGIVHQLLASHLGVEQTSIGDADGLDALGLEPLDVVLVLVRLGDLGGEGRDFPMATLARARTVGDLVALVDIWLEHETTPSGVDGRRSRRTSAA
jgi:Phosphopantetheine attachment site